MKIRIKFEKFGIMRFIGHLDIMRYFQKAIRRADIDIAYSKGFNPHQIMSFAAPLGVGLYSDGEYFDIECNSVTSSEDMKKRLQSVMVEGFEIVNVCALNEDAPNAMASVAAAKYKVFLRYDAPLNVDYISQIMDFYNQETIVVTKQTKKKEIELDIKPAIYELSCHMEDSFFQTQREDVPSAKKPCFTMLVDASSAGNIKPGLVLKAFYDYIGLTLGDFDLIVKRIDTYTNTGTPDNPRFVPLDAVGENIP